MITLVVTTGQEGAVIMIVVLASKVGIVNLMKFVKCPGATSIL